MWVAYHVSREAACLLALPRGVVVLFLRLLVAVDVRGMLHRPWGKRWSTAVLSEQVWEARRHLQYSPLTACLTLCLMNG